MLKATLVITDEAVSVSYVNADSVTLSITQGASLWEADGSDKIKPKGAKTVGALYLDLSGKVDVVEGKELSDNNYTDEDAAKLATLENYDDTAILASLGDKVDKVTGKELSDNNYTDTDKIKVDKLIIDGDGTKFLFNDGEYKSATAGLISASDVQVTPTETLISEDVQSALEELADGKQDLLENEVNLKSVNGTSLLGSGSLDLNVLPSGGTETQILVKSSSTDGDAEWQSQKRAIIIEVPGELSVGTVVGYLPVPFPLTITGVKGFVLTEPVDDDLIIDVNVNGTTIYTTQANRPTILDGDASVVADLPDDVDLAEDDMITIDIDQVGSTTAGSDLSIVFMCNEIPSGGVL